MIDPLFVNDEQCAARLGLTVQQFLQLLPAATKEGFPPKDPLFANRRYWPAVKTWVDQRYRLAEPASLPAFAETAETSINGFNAREV